MSRWFKYSLSFAFLLIASPFAFAQSDDDQQAAQALRSAADSMDQMSQIADGPDAACAKQFATFYRRLASKMETGSKSAVAKPTCSFGNEQLAALIASMDVDDKQSSTPAASDGDAASDPNAIVNEGNRQAAAIRAIGDANAAKQQQAAQSRLAAQKATQSQQRTSAATAAGGSSNSSASSSQGGLQGGPKNVLVNSCITMVVSGDSWKLTNTCSYVVNVALAQPQTNENGAIINNHNGSETPQMFPNDTVRAGYNKIPYKMWVCSSPSVPLDTNLQQAPSYDSSSVRCPTGGNAGVAY